MTTHGGGFAVTKDARQVTRVCGHLGRKEKARANRKNRRHTRRELCVHGEDAEITPKLWTAYDVA
jgi:hypothetical protein